MVIIAEKVLCQAKEAPKRNWAIKIINGRIHSLGPSDSLMKCRGSRVLNLHNAVLMPGLINAHSHLELPSMLNDIKARIYSEWVLNLLKKKSFLCGNDYDTATRQNIAALIKSGTTAVGEICTHGISPKHLIESELRAQIFCEIISLDQEKRNKSLSSCLRRNRTLVRFGLSPHSPHTVSEQVLEAIRDLQARKPFRLSMHAAETKAEGRLLRRERSDLDVVYNAAGWQREWAPEAPSSIALLDRIGVLTPEMLLVHAVDVNDNDIGMIKRRGAAIAHCPRSNDALHVGTMPLKKVLDEGIPVGLGTDSLASVPTLNLWDEMRIAYKIHKKSGITPKDILDMATMGGAKALGMENEIGSLEPGKKADIIAVPLPRKNTGDIHSDLLRETESSIMTMVNGKILYRDIAV